MGIGVTLLLKLSAQLLATIVRGRIPTRRTLATMAKLSGRRLERRWPYLVKASPTDLNLGVEDVLEYQRWRNPYITILVVGAFDGASNDPTSQFIRTYKCRAILVEPQPGPFSRLKSTYDGFRNVTLVNAAVDKASGVREMFTVANADSGMPLWTEQLGSFNRSHVLKHQDQAPGLAENVIALKVKTVGFEDLLTDHQIRSLDVLQIDAEGMDALLLSWFPFGRIKPNVLYYEIAHMTAEQLQDVRHRLSGFGYRFLPVGSTTDDMAILL